MPGIFAVLRKEKSAKEEKTQEKTQEKEKKIITANSVDLAREIMLLANKAISLDDILQLYDSLIEETPGIKKYSEIANCLLKLSVNIDKCLKEQEKLIMVFSSFEPEFFIKYFLSFCLERRVRLYSSDAVNYNCGLKRSTMRYSEYFEEMFDSHDAELFKLILDDKNLSARDAYNLLSWYDKIGETK